MARSYSNMPSSGSTTSKSAKSESNYFDLFRFFPPLVPGQRIDPHVNFVANQLRFRARNAKRGEAPHKLFNLLKTKLLVRQFAAPKTKFHIDRHILGKKVDRVLQLHPEVMRINVRAKSNFFDSQTGTEITAEAFTSKRQTHRC